MNPAALFFNSSPVPDETGKGGRKREEEHVHKR